MKEREREREREREKERKKHNIETGARPIRLGHGILGKKSVPEKGYI